MLPAKRKKQLLNILIFMIFLVFKKINNFVINLKNIVRCVQRLLSIKKPETLYYPFVWQYSSTNSPHWSSYIFLNNNTLGEFGQRWKCFPLQCKRSFQLFLTRKLFLLCFGYCFNRRKLSLVTLGTKRVTYFIF